MNMFFHVLYIKHEYSIKGRRGVEYNESWMEKAKVQRSVEQNKKECIQLSVLKIRLENVCEMMASFESIIFYWL